jgi:hypothetical protein
MRDGKIFITPWLVLALFNYIISTAEFEVNIILRRVNKNLVPDDNGLFVKFNSLFTDAFFSNSDDIAST